MPVLFELFDKLRRHDIKVFTLWHFTCGAVSHNSGVKTATAVCFSNCGTNDELSCSACMMPNVSRSFY